MAKAKSAAETRKLTAISEPYSKSQIVSSISDSTGLTRKDVSLVFEELGYLINRHIKKRGAGQFTLPGLLKITTTRKPAVKARKGINPFTKEPTVFKAKPATTVVKARPLKTLKDMAN